MNGINRKTVAGALLAALFVLGTLLLTALCYAVASGITPFAAR